MKHPFVAYCDKLRRQPGGELVWQSLMNSKRRISKKIFMKKADVATLFDPADYPTNSIAKILTEEVDSHDPTSGYYFVLYAESEPVYFFQSAGFEAFFSTALKKKFNV